MKNLFEYKIHLGTELNNFLEGSISFKELENRISGDDAELAKEDEIVKFVWHAIYQYETDLDVDDVSYSAAVRNRMRQISSALIENDPSIETRIDNYFNSPYEEDGKA